MIPVPRADEPPDFDRDVRQPGYRDGKTRIELLDDDMPLLALALRELFASAAGDLSDEQRGFRYELAAVRIAAGMPVP